MVLQSLLPVVPSQGQLRRGPRYRAINQKLGPATDYWGGDKNKDTGVARAVLHFAMQYYLNWHTTCLGQY